MRSGRANSSTRTSRHKLREHKRECERLELERSAAEAARLREANEHAIQRQTAQQQHDELTAQLHAWKDTCSRLEEEQHALQTSVADLKALAAVERDAYQLLELQLQDVDTARVEASQERDRLNSILVDAFAKYNRLRAAAAAPKETL